MTNELTPMSKAYWSLSLATPFVSQFVRSLGSVHREGNLHHYCGEKIVEKFVLNGAFREPSEFISNISID